MIHAIGLWGCLVQFLDINENFQNPKIYSCVYSTAPSVSSSFIKNKILLMKIFIFNSI